MMADIMQDAVNWLYKAPGWALVVILSIVIGYGLRGWKSFPNGAIPLMIIIIASLLNTLMAGDEPKDMGHISWEARNACIGAILGFLAWRLHKGILSKYEDRIPFLKLLLSSNGSGNTDHFTKDAKGEITTAVKTNEINPPAQG